MVHKFWHSRGYLPHCDTPGLLQAITFRLADSLPASVLDRLLQETDNDVEKLKRIENLLDAGYGTCWLKQPIVANIVENALLHGDNQHYLLHKVVQGWKSFTAKLINQYLGRSGTVWMRDYFDRYIRDDRHLAAAIAYIHGNPLKAGLVSNEQGWLHSSASLAAHRSANNRSADVPVGRP